MGFDPTAYILVRPISRAFAADEAGRLEKELAEVSRNTIVTDIGPSDLKMGLTGELRDGYRYTSTGLRQVCTVLCDGLYAAMCDLAGIHRDVEGRREEYSVRDAIKLFNRTLELREDRLSSHRLLRNTKSKLIDGTMGPRYTLIDNAEIFESASAAATCADPPALFNSASLVGRRLVIRFRQKAPLFTVPFPTPPSRLELPPGGDKFFGGLHFANSEIGGESSVRAAHVLYRGFDSTTSMGRFLGGRRAHTGRRFQQRLALVFSAASATRQDPAKLKKRFLELQKASLGVAFDTEEDRQTRYSAIASHLHEHGIPKTIGNTAVTMAVHHGSFGTAKAMPRMLARSVLESRMIYDLYNALTATAVGLYSTTGELVEQTAHKIMLGHIKIKS